jgi:lysozyme family protein
MADVRKLAPFILKWEGGFSNNPLDKGGATMKGITLITFTSYRKSKGMSAPSVDDLKNISDFEWTDILKKNYWDKWRADEIRSQPIANLLVGWVWGSGAASIKTAQKLLGVSPDGIVGNATLSSINNYPNQLELFDKILLARKDYFVNIVKNNPSQIAFLSGWLNRLFGNIPYNFNLVLK